MTGITAAGRRQWLRAATVLGGASLVGGGLAGCFPLAATGIAMGSMAMIDRRTVGAQADDQGIELKGSSALKNIAGANGVSVTSYNRKVLLTGPVTDEKAQREAEAAIAAIANVRSVHNETTVGFRPSMTTAANDTALTARVKAAFVEAAFAELRRQLAAGGELEEASYVTVREVPAADWGYGGLTQQQRQLARIRLAA